MVRALPMGNCLTCFKEPNATAVETPTHCHKEEMPEAPLYSAPSHVPASSAPIADSLLLSNGNHIIPAAAAASLLTSTVSSVEVVAGSTLTASAQLGSTSSRFVTVAGGGGGVVRTAKAHTKSTTAMGLGDSKPAASDVKLNALFDQYRDCVEDSRECIMGGGGRDDTMLAEGIEQLCKDLQISPDDFRILVLAWKLNAEQMCRFTRAEFVCGLRQIRADSVRTIQQRLPELVAEVRDDGELFKDLYRFTFRFGLDSATGQRILPTDMATVLWKLVFTVREPPILQRWLLFLERHPGVRGIPRDTWNMFLNFAETVGDDLSCYDDNEAWPSLFDDFVEYENDQANQNISKESKECDSMIIIGHD